MEHSQLRLAPVHVLGTAVLRRLPKRTLILLICEFGDWLQSLTHCLSHFAAHSDSPMPITETALGVGQRDNENDVVLFLKDY